MWTAQVRSSALTTGLTASTMPLNVLPGIGAEAEVDFAAGLHLADLALQDLGLDLDAADVDQGEELAAGVEPLLGRDLDVGDDAGEGRPDARLLQVQAGQLDVDLGLGQVLGRGHDLVLLAAGFDQGQLVILLGLLQIGLGDQPLAESGGDLLVVGLGLGQLVQDGRRDLLLGLGELLLQEEVGKVS